MSVAVARWATDKDHSLISDYAGFCHESGVSDRVLRDRLRLARSFLSEHPDLDLWMTRPTRTRLADLKRISAWSLVSWAALTGRIRIDLDLLTAKNAGGMSATVRRLWPTDFHQLWETAGRLGWSYYWSRSVIDQFVPALIAWASTPISGITADQLTAFEEALGDVTSASVSTRKAWKARLFGTRLLLFECGRLPMPPRRGQTGAPLPERLAVIPATNIRDAIARYVTTRSSVLAASSVDGLINDLIPFGVFLGEQFPHITALSDLERSHIETFLVWNRTRTWRGRKARDQQISPSVAHATVLTLRNFLDDITLWGWADRPRRRLVFATDIPRLPRPLPRALPPDVDAALMAAAADLEDCFARCAIMLLRRCGLRLGECLDLELDCVVDYGATGTWLRVPLGKLRTERCVPLDTDTVVAIDTWINQRGSQRPHPHPTTGTPTDFLFTHHGRRLKGWRIRKGLRSAAAAAVLIGPNGEPRNITPHQLRHTYATELANAGMRLQALMALLGHVTPEMTLRYATLSSPILRHAYDEAIGRVRKPITAVNHRPPPVPTKIEWIASEFLKTRVAHGYCSRHLAAGACPYANICETCDNFTPDLEHAAGIQDQLADIQLLRNDAKQRGWVDETQRHTRVIQRLESHLRHLDTPTATHHTA